MKEEENGFLNFLGDVGSGVTKVGKGLLDFLILDDVNTLADKDASLLDKGIAVASFIPVGKVLKIPKAIDKIVDSNVGAVVKKSDVDEVVGKGAGKSAKVNQTQLKIIDEVETGKSSLKTNKHKGNYGEMKMDIHYESKGYDRVSDGRVTSLDDKIIKGIDGVYENSNPPPQFIIAEAKYGTGKLGKTNDGPQMSEDWINGSNRLESAVGKEKADEILEAMMFDPDNVQSSLVHIDKEGNVLESVLDSAGKVKK
ncbi:hypothetical protein MHH37_13995 [Solibacillus sp. FSL K6-1781]|uniref:hypothetical protein n=1 Tax=Solibacillus sp. FSL K6-1781 TaxID=2921474 RepID=UPI00315AAB6E